MNCKILFASFALVFLAELGDKTQLTALAFSASSRSPWSVFIGTSLALVASTAIAVLLGGFLARTFPAKALHIASGVMFVLVGLTLLVNVARKAPAEEDVEAFSEPAPAHARGAVSSFVLKQAIAFEKDLALALAEHAEGLADEELKQAVTRIAEEHARHVDSLTDMTRTGEPADGEGAAVAQRAREEGEHADVSPEDPASQRLLAYLAIEDEEGAPDPLRAAVRKQEAAAQFYIALARLVRLHEARDTLRRLAMEEIRHAQHLCSLTREDQTAT